MGPLVAVLLLAVPIVELAVIVQVADEVGIAATLLLLVAISVAGAWLLKQQGMATWKSLQATMTRGEMPTKEAADGALILFGGALLLTPGFVTDIAGLFLLFPVTRAAIKTSFRKLLGVWGARRYAAAGATRKVYSARVTRVRREEDGKSRPVNPSNSAGRLPAGDPPAAAGDSPDRG